MSSKIEVTISCKYTQKINPFSIDTGWELGLLFENMDLKRWWLFMLGKHSYIKTFMIITKAL